MTDNESYNINLAEKAYVDSGGKGTSKKSMVCLLEAIYWELKEIIKQLNK